MHRGGRWGPRFLVRVGALGQLQPCGGYLLNDRLLCGGVVRWRNHCHWQGSIASLLYRIYRMLPRRKSGRVALFLVIVAVAASCCLHPVHQSPENHTTPTMRCQVILRCHIRALRGSTDDLNEKPQHPQNENGMPAYPVHRFPLFKAMRSPLRRWLLLVLCVFFAWTSFRVDQSAVSVSSTADKMKSQSWSSSSSSSSFFVPYPHRQLGLGMQLACSWKTRHSMTRDEMETLVGRTTASWRTRLKRRRNNGMDIVQSQALNEGVCLPVDNNVRDRIHLYSSNEAQRCLANKTVLVTGDDYSMELLVGLADILLNNPSDSTPTSSQQQSITLSSVAKVSPNSRCARMEGRPQLPGNRATIKTHCLPHNQ